MKSSRSSANIRSERTNEARRAKNVSTVCATRKPARIATTRSICAPVSMPVWSPCTSEPSSGGPTRPAAAARACRHAGRRPARRRWRPASTAACRRISAARDRQTAGTGQPVPGRPIARAHVSPGDDVAVGGARPQQLPVRPVACTRPSATSTTVSARSSTSGLVVTTTVVRPARKSCEPAGDAGLGVRVDRARRLDEHEDLRRPRAAPGRARAAAAARRRTSGRARRRARRARPGSATSTSSAAATSIAVGDLVVARPRPRVELAAQGAGEDQGVGLADEDPPAHDLERQPVERGRRRASRRSRRRAGRAGRRGRSSRRARRRRGRSGCRARSRGRSRDRRAGRPPAARAAARRDPRPCARPRARAASGGRRRAPG